MAINRHLKGKKLAINLEETNIYYIYYMFIKICENIIHLFGRCVYTDVRSERA